jgi:CheY-like chemotaxis protein
MPITVALAIGFDPWLLASQNSAWRSAGCFVTEAGSVAEAIDQLKSGDFDLVLLDHSIPAPSREGLTFLVRASGSLVPVVCLTEPLANAGTSSIRPNDPDWLLQRITGQVAAPKRPVPVRLNLVRAERRCA